MSARKLIYRLMVVAPALFLAGLAVNARSLSGGFNTVANDPRTEAQILAYVPYLRQYEGVKGSDSKALQKVRSIARRWVEAADRGELQPVKAVAFDDSSTDGAKSLIFQVNAIMVGRLNDSARTLIRSGKTSEGVRDALLAIRLAETVKYSDFLSVYNCASEQRHSLGLIQPTIAALDRPERALLDRTCRRVVAQVEPLRMIADRTRDLYVLARQEQLEIPISKEEHDVLAAIPDLLTEDSDLTMREMRSKMRTVGDDQLPVIASWLRLGTNSQRLLDDAILEIRNRLASSK